MFVIIASICPLICSRTKRAAPSDFAVSSSTHRIGTMASNEKYVRPAACIAQWFSENPLMTPFPQAMNFFISTLL